MALRSRPMVPSTASRVLIRLEKDEEERVSGVLYNPYLDLSCAFVDVMDFTNQLDAMFDAISFPQASMEYRTFGPAPRRTAGRPKERREDGRGIQEPERLRETDRQVFVVHVQFRQNATWQGTIQWTGCGGAKHFRSTLELIKMMDSALPRQKGNR